MRIFFVVLLLLLHEVDARKFRAVYMFAGLISDMSWNHMMNNGRILAHKRFVEQLAPGDSYEETIIEAVPFGETFNRTAEVARSGVDLIFTTSWTFQQSTMDAALAFPDVHFAHITGQGSGPENLFQSNIRIEQGLYGAGVLAGANTKTGKIGFVAAVPLSGVLLSISALYIGAQQGAGGIVNSTYIEHKVDVLVEWIWTFDGTDRELEGAHRLRALGCDVLLHGSNNLHIDLYAKEHNILSVGIWGDIRRLVGESVLTSTSLDFSPMFYDVLHLAYTNRFRLNSTNRSPDWYGYVRGGPTVHEPSFRATAASHRIFETLLRDMKSGKVDPVCYPFFKNGEVYNKDRCLTPNEIMFFDFLADGPIVVDEHMKLPGETCGNGSYHTVQVNPTANKYVVTCHNCTAGTFAAVTDLRRGATECSTCPPGTYSGDAAHSCTPCPTGSFSAGSGASSCTACPGGRANHGVGNADCPIDVTEDDNTVLIAVVSVLGSLVLLAAPVVLVKVARDRRELNKLYSEKAVANRCAHSIAHMRLEEVDYIRDMERPSEIIRCFVRIMDILKEYRQFLPLTLLAQAQVSPNAGDDSSQHSSTDESNSKPSQSHGMTGSTSGSHTSTGPRRRIIEMGTSRRQISVLVVNTVGFLDYVKKGECDSIHATITEALLEVFEATRGASEAFAGDRFVATYNTVVHSMGHQEAACRALDSVQKLGKSMPVSFSAGAAAGSARVGTVGCTRMKRYTFFGSVVTFAYALERFSRHRKLPNVVDFTMHDARLPHVEALCVDSVLFTKHSEQPRTVLTVTRVLDVKTEEWMYELTEVEGEMKVAQQWNSFASKVQNGDWEAAENEMVALGDGLETAVTSRFLEAMKERRFTPYTITHH